MKLPDNSDMDLKEQKDHGTASFPCGLYEIFEVTDWEGVKHHWHDEVEILYFMKGDFELDVNMETYHIQKECFYFINAGDLHSIHPKSACLESAVLFHPRILSFDNYDIAQSRILQPLLKKKLFYPLCLSPNDPAFSAVKKEYLDIVNVFYQSGSYLSKEGQTVTEDLPSQLFIRAGLLKILGILAGEGLLTTQEKTDDYRVEIIKNSLAYIHEHYQEKFSLAALADHVSMSRNECCRYFKQMMNMTITEYLLEYRLSKAAALLETSGLSITEIAEQTGFCDVSYFIKMFRRKTGITPKAYAKRNRV